MNESEDDAADLVAVVGMAGRFPGAASVNEYWRNLLSGRDVITRQPAGQNGMVPAFGTLDGATAFDADFFGFSPREAMLLDPQQRVLLECAWHALEDAGMDPKAVPYPVGVFAGASQSTYAEMLLARREELGLASEYQIRLGSGMDFVTTRISHRLGLTGPAVTVQSACSTSLVAVHVAATALLAGDCDVALAGGVSIQLGWRDSGQGSAGILARDGYCRPFDAAAGGTVPGSGVGLVVLRRLDEAIRDGHTVHAVLCGSGVSNDGPDRLGFTAPSVQGQVRAIRAALATAALAPRSIGFVEAHGTGTALGDPIEIAALNLAYADTQPRAVPCYLGSVKSAIGHLDAAAGVAGLIKAVLAVRDGEVPPTLHFTAANPEADLARVPFEVNTETRKWPTASEPRRAAVSSFGLGGTNAHVIVEQPPDPPARRDARSAGRHQLLVLSARTASALDSASQQLAARLTGPESTTDLTDVTSTLDIGRHPLPVRRYVVAATAADASDRLDAAATARTASESPGVFFLFPGHGSQYPAMAAGLDHYEPAFAEALDTCAEPVADATDGADLRKMLADPTLSDDLVAGALSTFCVEWATACLWRAWGVEPAGVLGHSLGGIVAACVAGVLSPAEAIGFVATRSRLLAGLPAGAMLAVPADEAQLGSLLPSRLLTDLSVAVVNGPGNTVLAGPRPGVDAAFAWLREHGTDAKVLRIPAAGHSRAVEPILDDLRQAAARLNPRPPRMPWVSETTGSWVDDASNPEWWVAHTRQTVRFGTAIGQVLQRPGTVLLEVGPGGVLGTLARRHPGYDGRLVCSSLPHASDPTEAHPYLLEAAGRLWCAGVDVQWRHGAGRRVSLPGYPFARTEYAPDSGPALSSTASRSPTVALAGERRTDLADTAVATAFARVLGVDDVTGEDDFFDLGGDSLIATQLVAFLKAEWDIDLAPGTLFRARTVAAFTDVVRQTAQDQDRR